jgi:hypothetical protein
MAAQKVTKNAQGKGLGDFHLVDRLNFQSQ